MPIVDLQRSLRRLGRIRMGRQVATSSGKMRPDKIEQWRLTSLDRDLLAAAAELYGGQVTDWEGAPTGPKQWELFTESDTLDITIPPGEMAFSQFYELWSGGGCQRRCDGQTEQFSGEPCLCPSDAEERNTLAQKGKACKPTTRLFVILHRVPDIGMWHLETHGYYAAVELAGSIDILRMANQVGLMPQAFLRLEQRTSKKSNETLRFAVPVIALPTLSAGALMTGEAPAPALEAPRAALGPAPAAVGPMRPADEPAPVARPAAQPPLPGEGSVPARPAKAPAAKKTTSPPAQAPTGDAGAEPHPWSKKLHADAADVAKAIEFGDKPGLLLEAAVANVLGDPAKRSTADIPDQRTANRVAVWLNDVRQGRVEPVAEPTDAGMRYRLQLKGTAA